MVVGVKVARAVRTGRAGGVVPDMLLQDPGVATPSAPAHAVARLEQAEALAWQALYAACPAPLARELGVGVEEPGGALLAECRALDEGQFNRLFRLGGDVASSIAAITWTSQRFREGGLRNGYVQIAAVPEQARLEATAREAGLLPYRRPWAKFRHEGEVPAVREDAPPVIEIGHERADEFGATAASGFGMPAFMAQWLAELPGSTGWRCYLALDGEAAIGAGALYLDGVDAWLGIGAVLPTARRRGAQGALLARRVRDAREAGAHLVTTETGVPLDGEPAPSFANILRCGFRIAYERTNWVRAG